MLTCITCSKLGLEEPISETELNGSTTPRSLASKETNNNLIAKVKDLSLKLSEVYTQRRPFRTSTRVYLKGTPQCSLESDNETPEIPKSYGSGFGRSTSTPTSSSASSSKPAPGTPMLQSLGGRFNDSVFFEEEADTGVFITLLSKPKGKNYLRRVRFISVRSKRHRDGVPRGRAVGVHSFHGDMTFRKYVTQYRLLDPVVV